MLHLNGLFRRRPYRVNRLNTTVALPESIGIMDGRIKKAHPVSAAIGRGGPGARAQKLSPARRPAWSAVVVVVPSSSSGRSFGERPLTCVCLFLSDGRKLTCPTPFWHVRTRKWIHILPGVVGVFASSQGAKLYSVASEIVGSSQLIAFTATYLRSLGVES